MMQDSEIRKLCEEVEEYCSKATPGPWKYHNRDDNGFYPAGDNERCVGIYSTHNAYFIARARTDLPKLLSLLRSKLEGERWIPVTERLPEEGEEVEIFTTSLRRFIAKRRGNYFEMSLNGTTHCWHWSDDVTHWGELPSSPEVMG